MTFRVLKMVCAQLRSSLAPLLFGQRLTIFSRAGAFFPPLLRAIAFFGPGSSPLPLGTRDAAMLAVTLVLPEANVAKQLKFVMELYDKDRTGTLELWEVRSPLFLSK